MNLDYPWHEQTISIIPIIALYALNKILDFRVQVSLISDYYS